MNNSTLNARNDLALTGRLRAAINVGNTVLVQTDPSTGEPKGLTVDLAREIAARLDVPVDLIVYAAAGKVFEAIKRKEWDIAFLAIDPIRAAEIEFTAPYVIIEGNYVVPNNSELKTMSDVDRAGVRIALAQGSAYDLYLSRVIKHATLVRAPTGDQTMDMFLTDKLEAVAGVKQSLLKFMKDSPGLRMIEPRFMAIQHAMGTPKGRLAGVAYLKAFIEEMKASGFVAAGLQRGKQFDSVVAPAFV
jgi:polar amino acid transport system substrate-binding protein